MSEVTKKPSLIEQINAKKNARPAEDIDSMFANGNASVSADESIGVFDDILASTPENIAAFRSANAKPLFEELHKKYTFWVRKELGTKLDMVSEGNRGSKTRIVNDALEMFFRKNKL